MATTRKLNQANTINADGFSQMRQGSQNQLKMTKSPRIFGGALAKSAMTFSMVRAPGPGGYSSRNLA